jgi:hypothetical protein
MFSSAGLHGKSLSLTPHSDREVSGFFFEFLKWASDVSERGLAANAISELQKYDTIPSKDKAWCPTERAWDFVPIYEVTLSGAKSSASWQGNCFTSSAAQLSLVEGVPQVQLSLDSRSSALCSDDYVLASRDKTFIASELTKGTHKVQLKGLNSSEVDSAMRHGVRVMRLPCGDVGTLISALRTVELFVGTQRSVEAANIKFVREKLGFPFADGDFNQHVDERMVKSGDYFAIAKLNGLNPVIMFGTGGRTGHSAVAMRNGSELYVLESTAPNPFGKEHWPPPYGVIR